MFTQSVLLTELDKTTHRVELLIKQLKAVHEAYQHGQSRIATLTTENQALTAELADMRELLALQQSDVEAVRAEMEQLRARQQQELEKVTTSSQTELDAQRSRLEAERDEVRTTLQNRLDEQRSQLEAESARVVSQKEDEIETLRAQLASESQARQLQVKQANDRAAELEQQNAECKKYLDGMRTQVAFVRDQVVRILENLPKAG